MLRLARSRAVARPLQRLAARAFCTPAAINEDKTLAELDSAIADLKFKRANPPAPHGYTEAMIEKDAANGTINVLKIGEIFGEQLEPEMRKEMMKVASRINELSRKMKEPQAEIDWPLWEGRFGSIGMSKFISEYKASVVQREAEMTKEGDMWLAKFREEWVSSVKGLFDGPNGLTAAYESMDTYAKKEQDAIIAKLENMKEEISTLETMTIASVLEKHPDWKAAVEEDIANNIWDPTHIPEKIRQKVMAEEAEKEAAIASIMASAKGAIA